MVMVILTAQPALYRLGSRKWEAECHPGGATRDEGKRGTAPSEPVVQGTLTTHPPNAPTPTKGNSQSSSLLIPAWFRC